LVREFVCVESTRFSYRQAIVETQQRLTGNEPETGEQEFAGWFEEEA
jgi:hypothetical protein